MPSTKDHNPAPFGIRSPESGFALIAALLVLLVTGAIVITATIVGSNHFLVDRYHTRNQNLSALSRGGLEVARAMLNGDKDLYPDSGYVVLEDGASVSDGKGQVIPGVQRWLYAGPSGITSGQYGVFGTVVSVVEEDGSGVAVSRLQVFQESFAKYAYFTDIEPSHISFGGGDQIFGPVHTNDDLKVYSSGATFHGEVKTAGRVQGRSYADFKKGVEEYVAPISMPETADLNKLQQQAQAGGTDFSGSMAGGDGSATTRIEFVALDLNGDGDTTDGDEGFFRVYQSSDADWVAAQVPSGGMRYSDNCGHYHGSTFVPASAHPWSGPDSYVAALSSNTKRCYLGGADSLSNGFVANDGVGQWLQWGGAVSSKVAGRADAQYLFPITRELNPSFKGVIYVSGKVIISGRLRGRVTVAATGSIIIGDDVTYATDPSMGTCSDILGLFSGEDVVVANNTLNAPVQPATGQNHFTYDDTKDEFIHAVVLALNIFTVEDYASGHTKAQPCEGTQWGRGCLYLAGGIIQETRGAVGTIWHVGGTGYLKRYAYDACAATAPPPYFPTTGHFAQGQSYSIDPVGFSVDDFYERFTAR